jgi:hypothetical protein
MEVVGFWTEEYLLRKIEKLKKVDVNMLVLVNEDLACEKLADLQAHPRLNIIYYRDRVPLAPILRYLEEAFQGVKTKQEGLLNNLPVKFTEPVVNYEEFAARIGVSTEAVRTALAKNPPPDYAVMTNCLIRKDKLEQIGKKIEEKTGPSGRLSLPETAKIVETEGVEDAYDTIEALGYKIVWRGISTEKAEVIKPENKSK